MQLGFGQSSFQQLLSMYLICRLFCMFQPGFTETNFLTSQILVLGVFRGHNLTCHPTEYRNEDQCCPTCSIGSRVKKHCTEFRSTSCLDCDEGTFMNRPTGLTECFPCARCDSGSGLKIKTACTTKSDTVCEPLEGFYCLFYSGNSCVEAQKHRSCQPGQYISQNGTALRDTECSDCRDGTFSDGTLLTSCQPHTQCPSLDLQLIKPGTASTDAECGEHSSGAVIGAVVGGLVTCLVGLAIALFLVWRLKNKKDTGGEGNADNPQQGLAVINKPRDRSSDPSEGSSMFDKI
ncbi:tumor necrosis factor receptor superfamily member 14-like isoform X2 [Perca flavescens]|uniref:tumor necrosis factor receptor superfamily member 14-like isoform X2 n=1 Tax=Perca flavescens TaxID=8167 RepID=UPI00106EE70A|nr:tumor necrosis factor receptor superfamily member 14-like isoform X2 [Perca flavescens]